MALTTFARILNDATERRYGIGSFNAWDLYSARTIVSTAERLHSPVIISLWQPELDLAGEALLYDICLALGRSASVPVAVFLDHAPEIRDIERAVQLGATSVMIDGSHLPLAENIALTSQAAEIAHRAEVSIEGEIGVLGEEGGSEPDAGLYTDPGEAERFAEESGVDALAVAVGNAHGFYRREPRLDFERLSKIKSLVDVPLVLHGGTGIPADDLRHAVELGIAKVNIGSECRKAFLDGLRRSLSESGDNENFPHNLFPPAIRCQAEIIEEKMRVLCSEGKSPT